MSKATGEWSSVDSEQTKNKERKEEPEQHSEQLILRF